MENYTSEQLKLFANRFKEERKKANLKNKDLARILNYSDEHSITPFNTGKKMLDEDRIKTLANCLSNIYGNEIRWQYLAGIDNFRTEGDVYKAAKVVNIEIFQSSISLLRNNGISLEPCIFFNGTLSQFSEVFHDYKSFVKDIDFQRKLQSYYDTSDFIDNKEIVLIELASDPREIIDFNEIDLSSEVFPTEELSTGGFIILKYRVTYNNEINLIDLGQLQRFIVHINEIIKSSVKTLIMNNALWPSYFIFGS